MAGVDRGCTIARKPWSRAPTLSLRSCECFHKLFNLSGPHFSSSIKDSSRHTCPIKEGYGLNELR